MVYPEAGIPVSTGTGWGSSIVNNSTNWNTAFSWGNHALAGYLTSYTETDPTVPSHVKAITTTNISNWNSAYGWGNHATQGYLTSAAIGVTVQPYNANTVIDGSYVHTDNNYTTTEKSKLAGIQAGAEVNVNADWNAVSGDAQILNKPTIPLVDSVPTSGSTNAVSSGSVFTALSFKADLVGGKVPAYQLPSFVDDVLEGYYNGTSFFIDSDFATLMTGETGKIYINLLNNTSYRYTGSVYVQISNSISTLNDLTDVTIGTLNNGQILQYNGTTSQWENVGVTIGSGDMQKSVYDIDNDGIVDYSETISVTVRNNSSTNILRRGTIVYLSGSTGNRPNAFKAQANAESTSSGTFGVVVNDIGTNSDGLVAAMGTLHNLDTRTGAGGNPNPFTSDTLLDGDILWLDPTTAGYVTKTKPSAPNHAVFIGIVAATSPTNGRIVYKIQNGYEVEELHNVKITEPLLNNQVLRYTQSTSLWENKTLNFQVPLTLTTSGTSGAATLAGDGVLNIPNYSTAPGGNTTEVQFNNSGAFGGSSKFTWSNDVLSLNTLTSPVSPVLQLSSYFSASGNEGKIGTRIYNVGQDFPVDKSMGILSFDVASGLMTNWQTAMSLISNFDINDNLQNVTLNVNGGLSLTNIPLITTDATNVLGVTSNGSLGKLSLDASTLSLSSAGVLSGVIKTLDNLTDVVISSPALYYDFLYFNGTNWVNGVPGFIANGEFQLQYSDNDAAVDISDADNAVTLYSRGNGHFLKTEPTGVIMGNTVAIGYGSTAPDTNAILTLNSDSKGLLLPRLTTAQITTNLSSATDGMMVYDSTTMSFKGRANGVWGSLGSGGGGGTPAGNTGEIQFNNAGAFGADNNLYWDNTNKVLKIDSENTAKQTLNVLTTATASTGWTGTSFTSGYTHTAGNTNTLTNTIGILAGQYYEVVATITGATAGTVTITVGGLTSGAVSTSTTFSGIATNTNAFTVTPTSDFNGTIVLSLKAIFNTPGYYSSEILAGGASGSGNWTGTSYTTGYTHTTGNTTTLLANGITVTSGAIFELTYTISGNTAGTATITFAGYSSGAVSNTTYSAILIASAVGNFVVTPTSTFNGTVTASIKRLYYFNQTLQAKTLSVVGIGNENIATFTTTDGGKATTIDSLGRVNTPQLNASGSVSAAGSVSASFASGFILDSGVGYIRRESTLPSPISTVGIRYEASGGYPSAHMFTGILGGGGTGISYGLSSVLTSTPVAGSQSYRFMMNHYTFNASGAQTGFIDGFYQNGIITNGQGITHNLMTLATNSVNVFRISDIGGTVIGSGTLNASAMLQVDSTSRGFLPPRMTTSAKVAITNPVAGLIVYDNTLNVLSTYDGSSWISLGPAGSGGPTATNQTVSVTGSTQTINFDNGINVFVGLQSSTTLTLQSTSRGTFVLRITQDGTGNRFINWPANVKWSGNVAPTLTTTAGATDIITLVYDNTFYYGTYALNF
jgi:hypothetical protein